MKFSKEAKMYWIIGLAVAAFFALPDDEEKTSARTSAKTPSKPGKKGSKTPDDESDDGDDE